MAVCDTAVNGWEYLLDFEFIKAFTCTYANTTGLLTTGLMVYGAIALYIYIRTDSIIIPFVLILLTGGAVLAQVASIASAIVVLILLTTGAGAFTWLYYRFSR